MSVDALAIVPVRVGSQRLPGKALLEESGKPLFLHTCEQAKATPNIDLVCVATDDDRVEAAARATSNPCARTSAACQRMPPRRARLHARVATRSRAASARRRRPRVTCDAAVAVRSRASARAPG